MFQSQPLADNFTRFFRNKSALSRLILINILVWLAISVSRVIAYLFQTRGNPVEENWIFNVQQWLAVPAGFNLWVSKPWTMLTYMFLQIDFWHLFFNMIWLYWFGKIFLEFMDGKRLLTVYFTGGVAGALAFMLAYNVFPAFSASLGSAVALGASASILAIVVSTSVMVPDYSVNLMFLGPVKIKYIAIVTIIMDVLMIRSGNAGGHIAHLGGAIAGYAYVWLLRSKIGSGIPPFLSGIRIGKRFGKTRFKTVHTSSRPLTDEEYNARKVQNQKKIDAILDKVARSGYKSLSEEEKEFLFKFSNK